MGNDIKLRRRGIRYPGAATLLLLWTLVGSLSYAQHYIRASAPIPRTEVLFGWLTWLTCFLPWTALSPAVFRLEQRYPLGSERWPINFVRLLMAGIVLSYVGAELTFFLNIILEALFRRTVEVPSLWWVPDSREMSIVFVIYACVVAAAYLIRTLINLSRREHEAAELALQKSELERTLHLAELETLRSRLNPHFLFNCLQNIAVLTQEDPSTAGQMLTRLGDLLRTVLRGDARLESPLTSEIALTKMYVAVETMRFSDRLSVIFDVAPQTQSALVPTFVLQPLVENAIQHGLRGLSRKGIILVRSAADTNRLLLTVTDNGNGLPVANASELESGLGLTSVCERLARMYPGQHTFSIRSLPEGGTEVLLSLPLQFEHDHAGVTASVQDSLVDRR